jgi:hypothetical protein
MEPKKGLAMAKRIVYGRRKVAHDGVVYRIELRADGLWVRPQRRPREWVQISFNTLIKFIKPQLELGLKFNELDKSDEEATVSTMSKGQLVPDKPEGSDCPLHADAEQPSQTIEGQVVRLDTPDGRQVDAIERTYQNPNPGTGDKLPPAD